MMEKLVLLQYNDKGRQGTEILTALKTFRHHALFDFRIVIFGEGSPVLKGTGDPFFDNIEIIDGDKGSYAGQRNQHIRVAKDLLKCAEIFGKEYNTFLSMSDDFYSLNPFGYDVAAQPKHISLDFTGDPNAKKGYWRHDKWKTRCVLAKNNLPHVNYTSHTFVEYDFERLKDCIGRFDLTNESMVLEDLYFNTNVPAFMTRHANDYRVFCSDREEAPKKILEAKEQGKFWCAMSVDGYSPQAEKTILECMEL